MKTLLRLLCPAASLYRQTTLVPRYPVVTPPYLVSARATFRVTRSSPGSFEVAIGSSLNVEGKIPVTLDFPKRLTWKELIGKEDAAEPQTTSN